MSAPRRLLDWRSGGWLLLLAGLLVVAVAAWRVIPLLETRGRAVGDGRTVSSYGFDLDGALVARERIVAAGVPRDGIPSIQDPPVMPAAEVAAFNEAQRGKYLVATDRVIGVAIGGESRAYPIRVLNWHEVVNDSLGGVPIAVTYSPLCDSAVVFDRRVGGETLEFGVSGLLFNSNLLLYDRKAEPEASSLWSQLQARAIAGPAALEGSRLEVLPASVARWSHWLERFPRSTVLRADPDRLKRYQRDPYGSYLTTGKPRFPVDPMPPVGALSAMSPVLVVRRGGWHAVFPLDREVTGRLALVARQNGVDIEVDRTEFPVSVLVRGSAGIGTFYSRWFAWYAHNEQER